MNKQIVLERVLEKVVQIRNADTSDTQNLKKLVFEFKNLIAELGGNTEIFIAQLLPEMNILVMQSDLVIPSEIENIDIKVLVNKSLNTEFNNRES